MPHIHTQPGHHDFTTSAYLVRFNGDTPEVALHEHKKHGMLLPFGGHVELDEHPWSALAHELEEESGYEFCNVQVYQPRDRMRSLSDVVLHPQPVVINTHGIGSDHFHTDIGYALRVEGEPTLVVSDDEKTTVHWVGREQLVALPDTKIWDNAREVTMFVLDVIVPSWELVAAESFDY